jgi:hypothetical protein
MGCSAFSNKCKGFKADSIPAFCPAAQILILTIINICLDGTFFSNIHFQTACSQLVMKLVIQQYSLSHVVFKINVQNDYPS